MNNLVITMPEHNEGHVLFKFIDTLETVFSDSFFVIVDDKSPIDFQVELKEKYESRSNFLLVFNEVNLGHGISTLVGLKKAVELDFEYIISLDGDGQFDATEIRSCFELLIHNSSLDLIEGVRTLRDEPWFRKLISSLSRVLVFSKTLKWPKDANTPLRVYRINILEELLKSIPQKSLIPNLHISKMTRKKRLNFREVNVKSLPRGGNKEIYLPGVTWQQRFKFLPSKRLVLFCFKATKEWLFS